MTYIRNQKSTLFQRKFVKKMLKRMEDVGLDQKGLVNQTRIMSGGACKISESTMSRIINGKAPLSVDKIFWIGRALGIEEKKLLQAFDQFLKSFNRSWFLE